MNESKENEPIPNEGPDLHQFQCGDPQVTLEWLAVLSAKRIPYHLSRDAEKWSVSVEEAWRQQAINEIDAYEGERDYFRRVDSREIADRKLESSPSSILIGMSLFIFFLMTGPYNPSVPCFEFGIFSSNAFCEGQWWRAVTALTLHSNLGHALGNILFLVFFASSLTFVHGGGGAWALILASGALGNAATAWLHYPWTRQSLGASTAVFGALGLLASARFLEKISLHLFDRAWIPMLAALAILASTGVPMAANGVEALGGVDVIGHLMGFCCGLVLGIAAHFSRFPSLRNVKATQVALALATVSMLLFCWWRAARVPNGS